MKIIILISLLINLLNAYNDKKYNSMPSCSLKTAEEYYEKGMEIKRAVMVILPKCL